MSHPDRFRVKQRILTSLGDGDIWSWSETNLLLAEFGLPTQSSWDDPPLEECLTDIGDNDLVQLASVALAIEPSEVLAAVESAPDAAGNWKSGYLRVFLTHSAKRKAEAAAIADELAVVGIHGFVAHDTIAYTRPWQSQIEAALRSMQALVALVHPELEESVWCHQEVGWAMGRRVPYFAVRIGADPLGFLGSDQWPSVANGDASAVSGHISTWISGLPELGASVIEGLIRSLGEAGNYYSAEAAAERISRLGSLSDADFDRLNEVWWSNDQLFGGHLPKKVMQRFYASNGKAWPPPKPAAPDDI